MRNASRRQFMEKSSILAGGFLLPQAFNAAFAAVGDQSEKTLLLSALTKAVKSPLSQALTPHEYTTITQYNNFMEFSPNKEDVASKSANTGFRTDPWRIKISGECDNPSTVSMKDILALAPLEERIFNFRCVEGWSKVVPWNGFSLSSLLQHAKPNKNARFVEFLSYYDPQVMASSRFMNLKFPYVEGLRLDEAMHALTTLSVGIGGKPLLPQSGAPVRVVVPWKYGFKGAKSITEIRFVKNQPVSTWEEAQPSEYGFFANVNPTVPHPRWSQKRERALGKLLHQTTLMFNGFEDQVASLYAGMDLKKHY